MLAIEARDFAGGFSIDGALFQIGAFIVRDFSLGDTQLGFQLAIFPVQIEKDKSASADLRFAIKFIDLSAMQQKFANSFGSGNVMTGAFVRLDVSVVEESFTVLNPGEGITDVGLAGTYRFNLAAFELDAGFVALKNVKIPQRFTVQNRLGSHDRAMSAKKSGAVGRRVLLFEAEFACDDLLESDIGKRSARADLDHWPVAESKLTNALGDHIDE